MHTLCCPSRFHPQGAIAASSSAPHTIIDDSAAGVARGTAKRGISVVDTVDQRAVVVASSLHIPTTALLTGPRTRPTSTVNMSASDAGTEIPSLSRDSIGNDPIVSTPPTTAGDAEAVEEVRAVGGSAVSDTVTAATHVSGAEKSQARRSSCLRALWYIPNSYFFAPPASSSCSAQLRRDLCRYVPAITGWYCTCALTLSLSVQCTPGNSDIATSSPELEGCKFDSIAASAAVGATAVKAISSVGDSPEEYAAATREVESLRAHVEAANMALAVARSEVDAAKAWGAAAVEEVRRPLQSLLGCKTRELEETRQRLSRELETAKAELERARSVGCAAKAKVTAAEAAAAKARQEAMRATAAAEEAHKAVAVAEKARAAAEVARTEAAEAAERWRATLSAAAVEDPPTVAALRAQVAALKEQTRAATARADALAAEAARAAPLAVSSACGGTAHVCKASKQSKGGVASPSSATTAAPGTLTVPFGATSAGAAAVAEAALLRAERDAASARAAALDSELAAALSRLHATLAAVAAPPPFSDLARPLHGCGKWVTAAPPSAAAEVDSAHVQLDALRTEVAAHKAAAASASASAAATAASLAAVRDDLVRCRGLEESARATARAAAERAAKAERAAAAARAAEATAVARCKKAESAAALPGVSPAEALELQVRLAVLTSERDDALEAVRRITGLAASHERRADDMQAATQKLCDTVVRQQEGLAAARKEAEEARVAEAERARALSSAALMQGLLEAAAAQATAAESRAANLQVCASEDARGMRGGREHLCRWKMVVGGHSSSHTSTRYPSSPIVRSPSWSSRHNAATVCRRSCSSSRRKFRMTSRATPSS